MPVSALALVISAAFIHAYWNLLVKRAEGGAAFVWLFSLGSAVVYAPVVLILVIVDPPQYGLAEYSVIIASGFLHLLYALTLNHGYKVGDLSVVYPIARGTGPLLSTTGAFLLLREPATGTGIAGMLCVVIGVLLIATQGRLSIFRNPQAWVGVRWGMVIGLFNAVEYKRGSVKLMAGDVILCCTDGIVERRNPAGEGHETSERFRVDDRDDAPVYVISVAADLAGLHPQTLRAYEREGLITPARTEGGTRRYSRRDVERLRFIRMLTQDEGLNLAGVRIVLDLGEKLEASRRRVGELEEMVRILAERVDQRPSEGRTDIVKAPSRDVQVHELRRRTGQRPGNVQRARPIPPPEMRTAGA